jgi:hypothetical protein
MALDFLVDFVATADRGNSRKKKPFPFLGAVYFLRWFFRRSWRRRYSSQALAVEGENSVCSCPDGLLAVAKFGEFEGVLAGFSANLLSWEEGDGALFSIVFNKFQIANCSMG